MGGGEETRVWIGPSGWSYPDWAGIVYPRRRPRGFAPLRFLARYFNAVEVNSSFYAIPSPRVTAKWVKLVGPDFRFAFKLTRCFTHEPQAVPDPHAAAAFKEAVAPVREAGRLGPLLIQFPWSFRFEPKNVARLRRLAEAFADCERVIEVRHTSWETDEGLTEIRNAGAWCNIDQPRLRDCLGPAARVFGSLAYVRLHGRNAADWFARGVPPYQRYNYLYSQDELNEWIARLDAICASAQDVFVFANNHYRGQGVVNALELRAMLGVGRIAVPPDLLQSYPRLASIALPPPQPGLFDAPR